MLMYLKLFITFFQIGLLSFGGGYAAIPLVENQVVVQQAWMSLEEFADIITIDELTPGPIAINTATFVGTKMAGVGGAICATLGCLMPAFIITLVMAKLYYKYRNLELINGALTGLRSMAVALIGSTALTLLVNALFGSGLFGIVLADFDIFAAVLFSIALFLLVKKDLNPFILMIGCGVAGLIVYPFIS